MPNCEYRPTSAIRPARIALAVPLLAGALVLGACTGGGSSSPSSATPTSGGQSSSSPSSPDPSASAASSIAHANPLVYQAVKPKVAKTIEKIAARAPGVQSVSYDNEHKTLSLYLDKSITGKERIIADRVVNQVLHPATTPTASKSKSKSKSKHH